MPQPMNLNINKQARKLDSNMSVVEAVLMKCPQGARLTEIAAQVPGLSRKQVSLALHNLARHNRAHCVEVSDKIHLHFPGPRTLATRVLPRAINMTTTNYLPSQWSNEIARPGGEDHKQYGSLQPDGTVKPYHAPRFGCTGLLKDKTSNGRDE